MTVTRDGDFWRRRRRPRPRPAPLERSAAADPPLARECRGVLLPPLRLLRSLILIPELKHGSRGGLSFYHLEWRTTELQPEQRWAQSQLCSLGSALQLGQRWEREGASCEEASKVLEGHKEKEEEEEVIGEVLQLAM